MDLKDIKAIVDLMKKNSITEFHGTGAFRDEHSIDVSLNDGGTTSLTAFPPR